MLAKAKPPPNPDPKPLPKAGPKPVNPPIPPNGSWPPKNSLKISSADLKVNPVNPPTKKKLLVTHNDVY